MKVHGASVHFVTAELDDGPIVIQAAVPVLTGDDEDKLAARVLAQEHLICPQAVRWFVEDRRTRRRPREPARRAGSRTARRLLVPAPEGGGRA